MQHALALEKLRLERSQISDAREGANGLVMGRSCTMLTLDRWSAVEKERNGRL
jgi:hypothetical protein